MTPQQLIEQCEKAIAHPILGGPEAKISLVLRGQFTNSGKKRLWKGKGAPVGECVSDADDKHVMVVFRAQDVLDAVKCQEEIEGDRHE